MRLLMSIILLLFLTGCSGVGKMPPLPDPPAALTSDCQDLGVIAAGEERLSEVLKVVTSNYGKYHECRIKVQLWNDWYNRQREIYGELK